MACGVTGGLELSGRRVSAGLVGGLVGGWAGGLTDGLTGGLLGPIAGLAGWLARMFRISWGRSRDWSRSGAECR